MTNRKSETDPAMSTAKRERKKASPKSAKGPSPQPDLLGDSSSTESVKSEPEEEKVSKPTPSPSSVGPDYQQPQPASFVASEAVAPPNEDSLAPAEAVESSQEPVNTTAPIWLLATNHLNMLYMLAAGMVMGPAGFAGKHYRDPSSEVPGLIPVFRDRCPETAIQQSVSEKGHLRACIAEIDLAGVEGPVHLVSHDGVCISGSVPSGVDSYTALLLVPAPFPVSRVKRLAFCSPDDLKEFEVGARNVANIDLDGLSIEVNEQLFSRIPSIVWPLHDQPQDSAPVLADKRPARAEAIGGMLAMLYQLANRSDVCCSAYHIASGVGVRDDTHAIEADSVLAELGPWIETCSPRPDASVQAKLYWGAVQALIDARRRESKKASVDVVLDFLAEQVGGLQETGHESRLTRLISDMRSTFGLGGGTISQLFERHKGTLSRPLLLLCLRERCVDLLEFSHPDLMDEELVLAAVLFGVRDGWGGLPVGLRAPDGLSHFVEHRMFEAETSQRGARLSLTPVPLRPVPLRELLAVTKGEWGKVRSSAVAKLATRLGWHDCLVSRVRLPAGQYRLSITDDGVEIIVRGVVDTPAVEIDRAGLLKRVAQWPPVPNDVESELRAALATGSRS